MHGGEIHSSMSLQEICQRYGLPIQDYVVDDEKTNNINFSVIIGKGQQGTVRPLIDDDTKVVKLINLKTPFVASESVKSDIIPAYYASNIGIGPRIYGEPFITTDGNYVGFIMDRIEVYLPVDSDVDEIIQLHDKSVKNNFLTFDSEFGKTITDPPHIVLVDFGIAGFYESIAKTIEAGIDNDLFENTGIGFYHPKLKKHIMDLYNSNRGLGKKKTKKYKKHKYKKFSKKYKIKSSKKYKIKSSKKSKRSLKNTKKQKQ